MARKPVEAQRPPTLRERFGKLKGQLPDTDSKSVPAHLIGQLTGAGGALPHFASIPINHPQRQEPLEIHVVGHPGQAGMPAGAERNINESRLSVHGTVRVNVPDVYAALMRIGANLEREYKTSGTVVSSVGRTKRPHIRVANLVVAQRNEPETSTGVEVYVNGVARPVSAKVLRSLSKAKVPGVITLFASRKGEPGADIVPPLERGNRAGQSMRVGDVLQGTSNRHRGVQDWVLGHADTLKNIMAHALEGLPQARKGIILNVGQAPRPAK